MQYPMGVEATRGISSNFYLFFFTKDITNFVQLLMDA